MAAPTLYDMISIKLQLGDETRRLKLPLKDLTPSTLPSKLCGFLNIPSSKTVVFERYSDSAGAYVVLDSNNTAVYKQLYRAAKAKAKLRIKVTVADKEEKETVSEHTLEEAVPTIKSSTPSVRSSQTAFTIPVDMPRKVEVSAQPKIETKPIISSPLRSWTGHLTSFTVQCNYCGDVIPGAHYHCDICDNNDFDLCSKCVDSGIHCDVDDHYLIKRSVVDGKISNSTTYKVAKKLSVEKKQMPGAFQPEIKETPVQIEPTPTRTCNSCITSQVESKFITCIDCDDYDLCEDCFTGDKHGHHPAHKFKPVDESTISDFAVTSRLASGRGLRHYATCDGCDKNVFGVRHKCLSCPDFDFCSICVLSSREIHPGHRFAPLYDHIGYTSDHKPTHNFIKCDGPLCKSRPGYIRGDRYKCAVCPDTDFCANCEAIPSNDHCRTHPLIKLRTPIRNVSVTTFGEDGNGEIMSTMGDKPPQKMSKSTETNTAKSANAATQVQTIAEIRPASPKVEAAEPVKEEKIAEPGSPKPVKDTLQAHFVSDSLIDGTQVQPEQLYTQTWLLRNPGPLSWPAGCSVRYTGGDNMLNISTDRPASTKDIETAVSSNTFSYEIKPQEEVQFSVTIKSPKTLGRAISYWRLKTPQGLPFGHKLWCDVEVLKAEPVVKKVVKEEPKEAESKLSESQMVFPTLEKESPSSSVITTSAPKAPSEASTDDVEFLDDLEHLALSDDDSDDAFLTDEEYDMLDTDSAIEEAINGKK